jgi:hypothetical protein
MLSADNPRVCRSLGPARFMLPFHHGFSLRRSSPRRVVPSLVCVTRTIAQSVLVGLGCIELCVALFDHAADGVREQAATNQQTNERNRSANKQTPNTTNSDAHARRQAGRAGLHGPAVSTHWQLRNGMQHEALCTWHSAFAMQRVQRTARPPLDFSPRDLSRPHQPAACMDP